ncbi:MAG: QueT transporter family protein, partial [Oscillospiraceae bacterium]
HEKQGKLMRSAMSKKIAFSAMIAAVYAALSLLLAPLSFGQIQLRAAEALTILPVFNPFAVWGITLGCLITNIIGMATGANVLGAIDVVLGTLATLVSALLTARMGNLRVFGLPIPATLPPVFINAAVVGTELCFASSGILEWRMFATFAGLVAVGQFGACTVLGMLLFRALERSGAADTLRRL